MTNKKRSAAAVKHKRDLNSYRRFCQRSPCPKLLSPLPKTPVHIQSFELETLASNPSSAAEDVKSDYQLESFPVQAFPAIYSGIDPQSLHSEDPRRFSVRSAFRRDQFVSAFDDEHGRSLIYNCDICNLFS